MALVDLVSDLSKFRSTVKSTGNTTPETSKVKDSKSFGALLPITEKLAQLATNVPKPTSVPMESRLSSTELDDVVKIIQKDLIINSVSKFSPVNAVKNSSTIGRVSIENIISRFDDIRKPPIQNRLDKSDIVIIRSESGINNLDSLVDINRVLSQSIDRSSSSPNINKPKIIDDKSESSPDISKSTEVFDKSSQSPSINLSRDTPDKSQSSPGVNKSSEIEDKSGQSPSINLPTDISNMELSSPDIFVNQLDSSDNIVNPDIDIIRSPLSENKSNQSPDIVFNRSFIDKADSSPDLNRSSEPIDKTSQSPSVELAIQSSDRTTESPNINNIMAVDDKAESSPDVFFNARTLDKADSSPNIKKVDGDFSDNITNPDVEIIPMSSPIDRKNQSVLINKDIISPINNIVNPNVELDINVLTFDKRSQSPKIKTSNRLQGFVRDPQIQVVKIEQGTNHLIDESRLNIDDIPFRFVTTSRLSEKQTGLQKDSPRYNGQSNQLVDNSELNADSVIKTNPSGRNENPERSGFSIKGFQEVNFFSDKNAKGFTIRQEKGKTFYLQNSEFSWVGSRSSPKTTGNFTPFIETVGSLIQNKKSKYRWEGTKQQAPSVNYFDVSKKNTSSGFDTSISLLESKYLNNSSQFQWSGNRLSAPETNFFGDTNGVGFNKFVVSLESKYNSDSSRFSFSGNLPSPINFITDVNANGFTNKPTMLTTLYKTDTSKFSFKGTSQNAPSVNYFLDTSNKGFTTFIQSLTTKYKNDSSRFSFKGTRQQAPSVDYFTNTNSTGFNNFAEELRTNYDKNTSRFTWVGNRQQAPEVDFFGIPGKNPKAIAGFTKLFVDKTATKLSYKHSSLSFAGTTVRSDIKDVPFTKFFGFTPGELSGFMVGMQNRESSLYPILEPRLFADAPAATRFAIETQRGKNKRQRTSSDLTKYVNVSLGGLPWFDGTNFGVATLDNQLPFIKTKVAESNGSTYFRKYETLSKENTEGLGFLGKWATTRRSPSPLDNQYNKYKLQKESFNNDIVGISRQPYIVRGIQRDGEVENQRWGFGVSFDDGLVRGGAFTQGERILADAERVLRWTASMKGILFNAKQVGLQLMNPNVDRNPKKIESSFIGLSATQIYNPIINPILINTVSARAGIHFARHGLFQFSSNFLNKYEDATLDRESNNKFIDPGYTAFSNLTKPSFSDRQTNYNRLIGLMKELLPNSFQQVRAPSETGDPVKNTASRAAIELARQLTGQSGIVRLSSNFGGPQSLLGIGGTQINRARHPYLTHYTTTPLLMLTGQQKEPQYQESAKRDTFYAATAMYKDLFGDVLRTIVYNLPKGPYELGGENSTRQMTNVQNIQPSDVSRISKQNPFDAKYDLFKNRLRAVSTNDVQKNGSISDQVHPDNIDSLNPIKQYRALSYDKLGTSRERRRSRNGKTNVGDINDFRTDLLKNSALNTFSTNPDISDYSTQNLEDKFGFGKHGKAGVDRSNPVTSTVHYGKNSKNLSIPVQKSDVEFRGDRINIIDYKRGIFDLSKDIVYETGKYDNKNLPGASDLIEFYFSSLVLSGTENTPAEAIVFRAILGNIRDAHNGDWSPISYIGRADPLYTYRGYTREISFDFIVNITSRDEMKATWRKLNYLASWTAPEYTKTTGFIKAPIIRLNIGHLYRKMPGFVSSIEYTFDNAETTWETAQLKNDMEIIGPDGRVSSPGVLQLPKTINVSCNFTPIGVYRPEYSGIMYSLYDDTANGGLENGLIPSSNTKVNYFKTFEVDNAGNQEPNDSQDNLKYYKIEPGKEDQIPNYGPDVVPPPAQTPARETTTPSVPPPGAPFDNNAPTVPSYLRESETNT